MTYAVRRDQNGFAAAITRDFYTVLQLNPGTERNEEYAQEIVDILNRAESAGIK